MNKMISDPPPPISMLKLHAGSVLTEMVVFYCHPFEDRFAFNIEI